MNSIYMSHLTLNKHVNNLEFQKWVNLFHPSLHHRIAKMNNRKAQFRALLSKAMIYYELDQLGNNICPKLHPFKYTKKGNPLIEGVNINCSISYHEHHISVALCTTAKVGIDLETKSRNQQFECLPPALKSKLKELSISQWNELEAYAKYLEEGLSIVFRKGFDKPTDIEFQQLDIGEGIYCCVLSDCHFQVYQRRLNFHELEHFFDQYLGTLRE